MSDPFQPVDLSGGRAPPPGGGPDEDEKAFKKGNTGLLIGGGIAALLVTIGLGVLLLSGDDSEPYQAIGRQVNGMKVEHFDSFWACALPNQQLRDIGNNTALVQEINERAARSPRAYARHLRESCLVKLAEHEPRLEALIPPEDLQEPLAALKDALGRLRQGWDDYVAHLEQVEETYDEDAASQHLNAISRAWFDYKTTHDRINRVIEPHVTG